MLKTFDILLDIEKDLYSPANILFNISRNDFESIQLNFTIMQDNAVVDLTNQTIEMAIKKPSGLVVYQPVEITDPLAGKAEARLSIQAYVEFGLHTAELYIRDLGSMAVSNAFYFYSRESIMQAEEIESVNDWSALQQALFAMDKKPILVDGVPTDVPEYVGQMAFDITGKRAFISNDVTETGWQLLAAGEGGGGGIVYWADIIGKPAAFPAEAHLHEIADVNGLDAALAGKADDADLIPFITETEADLKYAGKNEIPTITPATWGEITGDITTQADLSTALAGKADDADLIPFITEAEADLKYAAKGETGGITAATWGEITGTITAQTDLQTALAGKADDADLAAKANSADVYTKLEIDTALAGKADDADLAAKADAADLAAKANAADVYTKLESYSKTEVDTALAGKADDADLAAKANSADVYAKTETYNKTEAYNKTEVDAIVTGITEGGGTIVQDNLISTSTTAALSANQGRILNESKADAADLAAKANSADVYAKTETYNKTEVDTALAAKADAAAVYTKTEIDTSLAGKADDADLAAKADAADLAAKANAADVYTKLESYSKTEVNTALAGKADDADLAAKANAADVYTKLEIDTSLAGKADDADLAAKANSADVYAKTETYNKTEVDTSLAGKADDADLAAKANAADVYTKLETYTKTEIDTSLAGKADDADLAAKADAADLAAKANAADVYTKLESYSKTEIDTSLAGKADDADLAAKANAADVYTKLETYTKTEVDTALAGKADDADLAAKANAVDVYTKTQIDTSLAGKVDDADLVPYITEAEADLKYEPIGGGSTAATWGSITGTLSAQTDLQTALDGKADDADLAAKANAAHTHTEADLTFGVKNAKVYVDDADNYILNTRMAGLTLWKGTQVAYDGLTPDANTLYFITG